MAYERKNQKIKLILPMMIAAFLTLSYSAAAQNPDSEWYTEYTNQARFAFQAGQMADAIQYLNKAIAIHPTATAYYNLGVCYDRTGKFEDAVTAFKAATTLAPDRTDAHTMLATDLYKLNRFAEAKAAATEALRLDPANAPAKKTLADAQAALDKAVDKPFGSEETFATEPPRDTSHNDEFFLQGNKFFEAQDWKNASKAYEKSIKLYPQGIGARFNLGIAYHNDQQYSKAIAQFKEVLKLDPDYPNAAKDLAASEEMAKQRKAEKMAAWGRALDQALDSTQQGAPSQRTGESGSGSSGNSGPTSVGGTSWSLISLGGQAAGTPPDFQFCRDGTWSMLHYGGALQGGRYSMQGENLVIAYDNGEVLASGPINISGGILRLRGAEFRYIGKTNC